MKRQLILIGAALAACSYVAPAGAATVVTGTYVTDPSQVTGTKPVGNSSSTAASDAISLQVANDSTNLYFYVTFNSAVDPAFYFAFDSDNNPATGYDIFGAGTIGSNLGIEYGTAYTQTATAFNTTPTDFGSGSGSVSTNIGVATTTNTEMLTVPLNTTQSDSGDAGGFTGADFPSTFTLELYQDSGNVIGPVVYTLGSPAVTPEPASLSLLALSAVPLLRRRGRSG